MAGADDRQLAASWAPIVVQAVSDPFRQDYLVRFDFDGDRDPQNNWTNAFGHDMPSTVYFWLLRGVNHDYVGYGFYYLRGPDGEPNDFHTTLLALERTGDTNGHRLSGLLVWDGESQGFVPGAVRLRQNAGQTDEGTPGGGSRSTPTAGKQDRAEVLRGFIVPEANRAARDAAPRELDIVIDDRGLHPVLYAGSLDHRLGLAAPRGDLPLRFASQQWDDWRGREFRERDYPPGARRGAFMGHPQFAVVYRPAGRAKVVAMAGMRGQGRHWHHWELIPYDLLPLSSVLGEKKQTCPQAPAQADKPPEQLSNAQMDIIKSAVAMLAGVDKDVVERGGRLDPALFSDPARLFKQHFPAHSETAQSAGTRW